MQEPESYCSEVLHHTYNMYKNIIFTTHEVSLDGDAAPYAVTSKCLQRSLGVDINVKTTQCDLLVNASFIGVYR